MSASSATKRVAQQGQVPLSAVPELGSCASSGHR